MQSEILPSSDPSTRYDRAGEPFGVRPFHLADSEALADFYERFEPQRAAQGLPPTGRNRIGRWLRTVIATGVHLVAWRGDMLIAHALVVPTARAGTAEYAVFLHQSERGTGVGPEVTRAAIESAREAGFLRLWLTVDPTNRAAVQAYTRAGFRFQPAAIVSSEAEMTLDLIT